MDKKITVQTIVNAPMAKVWACWNTPQDIQGWAFASDDWEVPAAQNDLRVGGVFKTVMGAKDKSTSFDFTGTYTIVENNKLIEYTMDDNRHVKTDFAQTSGGVAVTQTFDPETENPPEMQRAGWQAILDNFKRYVEGAA